MAIAYLLIVGLKLNRSTLNKNKKNRQSQKRNRFIFKKMLIYFAAGNNFSMPAMYGRKASGTMTLPSAC